MEQEPNPNVKHVPIGQMPAMQIMVTQESDNLYHITIVQRCEIHGQHAHTSVKGFQTALLAAEYLDNNIHDLMRAFGYPPELFSVEDDTGGPVLLARGEPSRFNAKDN